MATLSDLSNPSSFDSQISFGELLSIAFNSTLAFISVKSALFVSDSTSMNSTFLLLPSSLTGRDSEFPSTSIETESASAPEIGATFLVYFLRTFFIFSSLLATNSAIFAQFSSINSISLRNGVTRLLRRISSSKIALSSFSRFDCPRLNLF